MNRSNENHPAAWQWDIAKDLATRLFDDIVDLSRFTATVGIGKDRDGLYIGVNCGPDTPPDVFECFARQAKGFRVRFQGLGGLPVFANTVPPRVGVRTTQPTAEQLRMKPLRCGAEISILGANSPGTLGCFVTHRKTRAKGFVSCSHVLHPGILDHEGKSVTQPVSVHPDARIVGQAGEYLALKGIPRGQKQTPKDMNIADIGFAKVEDPAEIPSRPRDYDASHGALDFTGVDDAVLGDAVFKVGRSGFAKGVIDQVFLSTPVGLHPNGPIYYFNRIFTIRSVDHLPFSEQGDSGALIVRESDHNALGMIFAVTPRFAFAFPLDTGLVHAGCQLL